MVINMIYTVIIIFLIIDIISKLIVSRVYTLNNSVSVINNFLVSHILIIMEEHGVFLVIVLYL